MEEARLAELEGQMADPELYNDPEKWKQVSSEHQQLRTEIDSLYSRWEKLSLAESA